jgi:3',5'-cyclic AMP phosphodiesterase CpdA
MTAIRILHLSDTHLSPRTQYFRANNDAMLKVLEQAGHDLFIHTGDITLDGIRYPEDYALSRDLLTATGKEIRFLPGNHDVGDNPRLSQPAAENGSAIDAARVARFGEVFGDDRWTIDRGAWRLIGIDSMLIGSGLPQEAAQNAWIAAALADLGSRHLALFSHQPFYIDTPDPLPLAYWTVDPEGREALRFLMDHPNLRLIASGHLHQQRARRHGGVRLEWCPSIAFTTGPALVPEMGGTRQVGYLEHVLHDDGRVDSRPVFPPSWRNDHLEEMIAEVYPLAAAPQAATGA